MNNIKTILFLLCSFFLTSMVHAQSSTDQRREMKREIFKTFHKRSYTGEYPLRKIPTLPSTTYQTIRRAKTEAPLFTDRVWFPGEWEEVKAFILTPYYENQVPGHEDDLTWNAEPMVKDYANYYHKNDTIDPVEWDGKDTCTIRNKYKPALTQDEVRQALQEMLGQRATHIVPRFLYDGGNFWQWQDHHQAFHRSSRRLLLLHPFYRHTLRCWHVRLQHAAHANGGHHLHPQR